MPSLPFRRLRTPFLLLLCLSLWALPGLAQDRPLDADELRALALRTSGIPAPDATDSVFVVDEGPFLDTGCSFRSQGPLLIEIPISRVLLGGGVNLQTLIDNGVIAPYATLYFPAFDVDYGATNPSVNPERDLVLFNGQPVSPQFLQGEDGLWRRNEFRIPMSQIEFPEDPGPNGTAEPVVNTLEIRIDTANSNEAWCTAIDWVALEIEAARPVAFFHGIFSNKSVWNEIWIPEMASQGYLIDSENLGILASIQTNARIVGKVVERMKARWGVDRVSVVSHSKGGLDSRHYAQSHSDIDRLVQLGTPNAGSPLADYVQAGGLVGSFANPAFARAFQLLSSSAPAGRQLMSTYMTLLYNPFHPLNPGVRYSAIAGNYDADLLSGWQILNTIIPGDDDTIVPVWSVHALSIADERTYPSAGGTKDALHTQMHRSKKVFDAYGNRVQERAEPVVPPDPTQRTATIADVIAEGEVKSYPMQIADPGPLFLTLHYSSGDLDFALVTPGGTRVSAATAPGLSGVSHQAEESLEGFRFEGIVLDAPEAGLYTLEVAAPSVTNPEGVEAFLLAGWCPETDLRLEADSPNPTLKPGGDLVIEARIESDSVGVEGADVRALLRQPDESMMETTLADAGEGTYRGTFSSLTAAGMYSIVVRAEGLSPDGQPFSRETFLLGTVAPSSSEIAPPHTDRGIDENDNGLYDVLAVDVGIDAGEAGDFYLFGELTDATGETVLATSTAEASLAAGRQAMTLRFDGAEIYARGTDGPYLLRVVRLAQRDAEGELLPLEEANEAHTTAAYSFEEFEHPAVRLTAPGTLEAEDTDGNGLYDVLVASIPFDVSTGGFNEWTARLASPTEKEVSFASQQGSLAAGPQTIQIRFDGCRVRVAGESGLFTVGGFLFLGASGSLTVGGPVASGTLDFEEFECDPSEVSDIELLLTPGFQQGSADQSFLLEAVVFNNGQAAANNLVVTQQMQGDVTIDAYSATQGTCGIADSFVICSLGSLASGEQASLQLVVTPRGEGTILSSAEVVADEPDPVPANNRATAEILIGADTIVDVPALDLVGKALLILLLLGGGMVALRSFP